MTLPVRSRPLTKPRSPATATSTPLGADVVDVLDAVATVPTDGDVGLRVERVLRVLEEERRAQRCASAEVALGRQLAGPRLLGLQVGVVVDDRRRRRSSPGTARRRSALRTARPSEARSTQSSRRLPGERGLRRDVRSRCAARRPSVVVALAMRAVVGLPVLARARRATARQSRREAPRVLRLDAGERGLARRRPRSAPAALRRDPVGRVGDERAQLVAASRCTPKSTRCAPPAPPRPPHALQRAACSSPCRAGR